MSAKGDRDFRKNGEIGGGDNNELDFGLRKTRGDFRYNSTVAFHQFNSYPRQGFYASRECILSGSVFKMDTVQPIPSCMFVLPLDDIIIGRYGLEGRLQATLNGTTPQFENLNLKLDGNAHEFIAGIKTVFDFEMKNKLQSVENKRQTVWMDYQWKQTGNP